MKKTHFRNPSPPRFPNRSSSTVIHGEPSYNPPGACLPELKLVQFCNRFTKMELSVEALLIEENDGFSEFMKKNKGNALKCWQKQIKIENKASEALEVEDVKPVTANYCKQYLRREKCDDDCTNIHRYPSQDGLQCPLFKYNQCKEGPACIYKHGEDSLDEPRTVKQEPLFSATDDVNQRRSFLQNQQSNQPSAKTRCSSSGDSGIVDCVDQSTKTKSLAVGGIHNRSMNANRIKINLLAKKRSLEGNSSFANKAIKLEPDVISIKDEPLDSTPTFEDNIALEQEMAVKLENIKSEDCVLHKAHALAIPPNYDYLTKKITEVIEPMFCNVFAKTLNVCNSGTNNLDDVLTGYLSNENIPKICRNCNTEQIVLDLNLRFAMAKYMGRDLQIMSNNITEYLRLNKFSNEIDQFGKYLDRLQ